MFILFIIQLRIVFVNNPLPNVNCRKSIQTRRIESIEIAL